MTSLLPPFVVSVDVVVFINNFPVTAASVVVDVVTITSPVVIVTIAVVESAVAAVLLSVLVDASVAVASFSSCCSDRFYHYQPVFERSGLPSLPPLPPVIQGDTRVFPGPGN